MKNKLVVVRGAGDIATGTICRLFRSGFKVVALETDKPTVIRRTVAFAQAVYDREAIVEGIKGVLVSSLEEVYRKFDEGEIPIVIDKEGILINELKPFVAVDAILAKKNLGTHIDMAPIVIGLGPGFEAGKDVDAIIETNRGHNLGRVILKGSAQQNTGIPGNIEGYSWQRVIRAPKSGKVTHVLKIGDMVKKGQIVAYVDDEKVLSPIGGILRGLIQEGLEVSKGFKIGDVDPRGKKENCFSISDKARAIGGGVLEAILYIG